MDVGGNVMSELEEKSGVLLAFFASIFNSKTCCSWGTQTPEMEGRDGEQNEDSRTKWKWVVSSYTT